MTISTCTFSWRALRYNGRSKLCKGSADLSQGIKLWPISALVAVLALFPVPALATKAVTYYYTDPQGSVIATTDSLGNVTKTQDFRPFGDGTSSQQDSSGANYSGHVRDDESGLIYMQARFYDPVIGRFLSVDMVLPEPAALDLINRYAYAANNPSTLSDPTGMFAEGLSADDINCEVYHCEKIGGGTVGSWADSAVLKVPANTPAGVEHYFADTSPHGRTKAAMAVMDYFRINYSGIRIIYAAKLADANSNATMDQWGTLTLGPDLYSNSFGLMGAILSHEVEGHWLTQMFRSATLKQDPQSYWMREVQAYDTELSKSNIKRFGLTPQEVGGEMRKRDMYFNGLNDANKSLIQHHIYKPLGD